MKTARDIMTAGVEFAPRDASVRAVAQQMAAADVGALPVCGVDRRIDGVITDRDLALKVVAAGLDPATTKVDDVTDRTEVVTIGADDPAEEAIRTMKQHAVRRLPVVDGQEIIGMISQADIATKLSSETTGDLLEDVSKAPPSVH